MCYLWTEYRNKGIYVTNRWCWCQRVEYIRNNVSLFFTPEDALKNHIHATYVSVVVLLLVSGHYSVQRTKPNLQGSYKNRDNNENLRITYTHVVRLPACYVQTHLKGAPPIRGGNVVDLVLILLLAMRQKAFYPTRPFTPPYPNSVNRNNAIKAFQHSIDTVCLQIFAYGLGLDTTLFFFQEQA